MIDGDCETFISDCQVRAAAELVRHTWDPVVLSALRLGPTRRSALFGRIAGISDKALTEALQRLRQHGLVSKAPGTEPPAGAAVAIYRLSPLGASFAEGPLAELARWAAAHQPELAEPVTG